MLAKFAEAAVLLARHFVLFASIVLTVWLPGNLLINYLDFYVLNEEDISRTFKLYGLIDSLLSPVAAAAVIASLSRIKLGRPAPYAEVMGVALRKWAPLFWARIVADILVFLGFVALIVPGIMLLVRYALLDQAVVVEGADPGEARRRSTELTAGVRWEILAAAVLFFVPYFAAWFVAYLPLILIPIVDQLPLNVYIDCCMDIALLPIQIVMFLYYWEAAQQHATAADSGAESAGNPA